MIPPRLESSLISSPHGFFGREGGVSGGVFSSLNTSTASGDDIVAVVENRRRVSGALNAETLLTAKQIHSAQAVFVEALFSIDERPEADALVTETPGLALGVLAADCVPILIEGDGIVAAIHAGWRGSLAGVVQATVDLMTERGATISDLKAAIGPHLKSQSFEVRQDLIDEVLAKHPEAEKFFSPTDNQHALYDHTGFVIAQVIEAGITRDRIDDLSTDTLTQPARYFSYRAARQAGEKHFGHNVSAIALTGSSKS